MRYCAKFDHGGFETFLMINGWVMKDIGASRPQAAPLSRFEQLRIGREIVQSEAKALGLLAKGSMIRFSRRSIVSFMSKGA